MNTEQVMALADEYDALLPSVQWAAKKAARAALHEAVRKLVEERDQQAAKFKAAKEELEYTLIASGIEAREADRQRERAEKAEKDAARREQLLRNFLTGHELEAKEIGFKSCSCVQCNDIRAAISQSTKDAAGKEGV